MSKEKSTMSGELSKLAMSTVVLVVITSVYVCYSHDTQSTHWDSPRGLRQQEQLKEVHDFIQEHRHKLKVGVVEQHGI